MVDSEDRFGDRENPFVLESDLTNKGSKEFREVEEDYADSMFGEPLCMSCKHTNDNGTCKAYPEGIPLEIVSGRISHFQPYEGDNGIQYEKK